MTKFQTTNIVKHFDHNGNSVLALDGIDLNVEGYFICIVGPAGCGKSTFLNIDHPIIEELKSELIALIKDENQ